MEGIEKPAQTTYWVVASAIGTKVAGYTEPQYVTTFGSGTTPVWQGTDRDEWQRQCTAAGVQIEQAYE